MTPAWRVRLVGIYTDADERAEREVLGWMLLGEPIQPFTLRAEMFASRWYRVIFVACCAVLFQDGSVHPVRVLQCLRFYGWAKPGVAQELGELMLEAVEYITPPSFALFAERAELRLRVLRLEREVHQARAALVLSQ